MFNLTNCSDTVLSTDSNDLTLINIIPLEIEEPSGISFNHDKTKFWIVGDKDPVMYLTDLDGSILDKFSTVGYDCEGITSLNDTLVAIVQETTREILILTNKGHLENINHIEVKGDPQHGLEGITFIPDEKTILITNEKDPSLIIKVDFEGNVISRHSITFTNDLAGLDYEPDKGELWLLAKEKNIIFKCNLQFEIISYYNIPDHKFEGIAVYEENIYLVSDSENQLYVYELP